jgi:hypothetical protein
LHFSLALAHFVSAFWEFSAIFLKAVEDFESDAEEDFDHVIYPLAVF